MTSSNDDLDDELLGLGIGRARKQKSGRTGRDETRPAEQQARWLTPETVLQNVSAEPGGDGPTDPGPERWSEEPAAADLESGQALPSSRVGGFFPGTGSLGRSSERVDSGQTGARYHFRLDAVGQGGTVLRKVLQDTSAWVEVDDSMETHQAAGDAAFRLPSLTRVPRSRAARRTESAVAPVKCQLTWRTGRFKPSEYAQSSTNYRVNHIPGSSAICKKDQLVRNIRKMRGAYGPIFNFVPTSFIVPAEFTKFTCTHGKKSTV